MTAVPTGAIRSRPDPHGAGHHDWHRLPRCRRHLQGRARRFVVSQVGLDLGDRAIGILIGLGSFLSPLSSARFATILVLSAFRAIERTLPSRVLRPPCAQVRARCCHAEDDVRELVRRVQLFHSDNLSRRLTDDGDVLEYRMVIRSRTRSGAERLCRAPSRPTRVRVPLSPRQVIDAMQTRPPPLDDGSHTDP